MDFDHLARPTWTGQGVVSPQGEAQRASLTTYPSTEKGHQVTVRSGDMKPAIYPHQLDGIVSYLDAACWVQVEELAHAAHVGNHQAFVVA